MRRRNRLADAINLASVTLGKRMTSGQWRQHPKLLGEVLFIVPDGFEHPIRATEQYLAERVRWTIHPCDKCGMSELFDPPSILAAKVFPGVPNIEMFSSFCPICGGAQVVEKRGLDAEMTAPAPKSWWGRLLSSSQYVRR